jgi:hypothetical protein
MLVSRIRKYAGPEVCVTIFCVRGVVSIYFMYESNGDWPHIYAVMYTQLSVGLGFACSHIFFERCCAKN